MYWDVCACWHNTGASQNKMLITTSHYKDKEKLSSPPGIGDYTCAYVHPRPWKCARKQKEPFHQQKEMQGLVSPANAATYTTKHVMEALHLSWSVSNNGVELVNKIGNLKELQQKKCVVLMHIGCRCMCWPKISSFFPFSLLFSSLTPSLCYLLHPLLSRLPLPSPSSFPPHSSFFPASSLLSPPVFTLSFLPVSPLPPLFFPLSLPLLPTPPFFTQNYTHAGTSVETGVVLQPPNNEQKNDKSQDQEKLLSPPGIESSRLH